MPHPSIMAMLALAHHRRYAGSPAVKGPDPIYPTDENAWAALNTPNLSPLSVAYWKGVLQASIWPNPAQALPYAASQIAKAPSSSTAAYWQGIVARLQWNTGTWPATVAGARVGGVAEDAALDAALLVQAAAQAKAAAANQKVASGNFTGDDVTAQIQAMNELAAANQAVADATSLAQQSQPSGNLSASSRTLHVGMVGEDVGKWQGIVGAPVTKTFDAATLAATKSFQSSHGLAVDGIVGPATKKAAGIGGGAPVSPQPPPMPAPPVVVVPPPAPPVVVPPAQSSSLWKWGLGILAAVGVAVAVVER